MNIESLNPNQFVDIFGGGDTQQQETKTGASFGMQQTESDIFASTIETTTIALSTTDTTTVDPSTTETTTVDPNLEPDIFTEDADKGKAGRKPKYDFSDMTGYIKNRIENGKFVAIEEETEDGSKKPFIPTTPEEFDEVLELQINYKVDEAKKELEQKWYESKSPAWKLVAQFAETVDNPADIFPFIQGVQTIQTVANLDESKVEDAEQIVRARLSQRGEAPEIIETQVEALKTTNKLLETAAKIKPAMLQEEQRNLAQMKLDKENEVKEFVKTVNEIRENAIKAIEAPIFGKVKLKQEEKAAVYELIAEPDEQTRGYQIFNAIDSLFEKRDFETLRELSLLITNKQAFYNYIGASASNKTAGEIQRKLRASTEGKTSSANDYTEEGKTVISRNQYKTKPHFGRG